MSSHTIECTSVTKRFGERTAVGELSLAVPRGCAYGFLGHNGAGKTTLIRMLLGLTRPDAGTIRIGGHAMPQERTAALARVGAIVEEPHFHPHLTGRENLRVAAAVRDTPAMRRIDGALERVGLRDRADDRVRTYSQGMRQRLGIARCLLADPELLILDEPMNGLDPAGIVELRELIGELTGEGRTVFLSSHLLDEVEKTCDAAAVIDRGRLVAHGPIGELLHDGAAELDVGCELPRLALDVLDGHPAVTAARETRDGIRITLAGVNGAAAINSHLVVAGVAVFRLAPVKESLEERFFALTAHAEGER